MAGANPLVEARTPFSGSGASRPEPHRRRSSTRPAAATVTTRGGRYTIADALAEDSDDSSAFNGKSGSESESSEDPTTSALDSLNPNDVAVQYTDPRDAVDALLSRRDRKLARTLRSGLRYQLRTTSPTKTSHSDAEAIRYEVERSRSLVYAQGYIPGAFRASQAVGAVARALNVDTSPEKSSGGAAGEGKGEDEEEKVEVGTSFQAIQEAAVLKAKAEQPPKRPSILWDAQLQSRLEASSSSSPTRKAALLPMQPQEEQEDEDDTSEDGDGDDAVLRAVGQPVFGRAAAMAESRGLQPPAPRPRLRPPQAQSPTVSLRAKGADRFASTMSALRGQLRSREAASVTITAARTRRQSIGAGLTAEEADAAAAAAAESEMGKRAASAAALERRRRERQASSGGGGGDSRSALSLSMPELPVLALAATTASSQLSSQREGGDRKASSRAVHAMAVAEAGAASVAAAAEVLDQLSARQSPSSRGRRRQQSGGGSRGAPPPPPRRSKGRDTAPFGSGDAASSSVRVPGQGQRSTSERRLSFTDVHAQMVTAQARRIKKELQRAVQIEASAQKALLREARLEQEGAEGDQEVFALLSAPERVAAQRILAEAPGSAWDGVAVGAKSRAQASKEAVAIDRAFQSDAEAVAAASRLPHWLHKRHDFRRIAAAAHTGDSLFVKHALKVPGHKRSPREVAAIVSWMRQFERFKGERADYLATLAGALVMTKLPSRWSQPMESDALLLVVEGAVEVKMGDSDVKLTSKKAAEASEEDVEEREGRGLREEQPWDKNVRRVVIGAGCGVGPVTRWSRLRDRLENDRHVLQWQVERTDAHGWKGHQAKPVSATPSHAPPKADEKPHYKGAEAAPASPEGSMTSTGSRRSNLPSLPLLDTGQDGEKAQEAYEHQHAAPHGGEQDGASAAPLRGMRPKQGRRVQELQRGEVSDHRQPLLTPDSSHKLHIFTPRNPTRDGDDDDDDVDGSAAVAEAAAAGVALAAPPTSPGALTPLDSLDPSFPRSSLPRPGVQAATAAAEAAAQRKEQIDGIMQQLPHGGQVRAIETRDSNGATGAADEPAARATPVGEKNANGSVTKEEASRRERGLHTPATAAQPHSSHGGSFRLDTTREQPSQRVTPLRVGQPLSQGSMEQVAAYWSAVRKWLAASVTERSVAAVAAAAAVRKRAEADGLDLRGNLGQRLVLAPGAVFPASLEEVLKAEEQKQTKASAKNQSLWKVVRGAVRRGRDLRAKARRLLVRAIPKEEGGALTGAYLAELRLQDLAHSVRLRRLAAKQEIAGFLRERFARLFRGWGDTRLLALANVLRERKLPRPGSVVWRQGDDADGLVFVLEGCVDVVREVRVSAAHRFPLDRKEWRVDFADDTEPLLVRTLTAGGVSGCEALAPLVGVVPGTAAVRQGDATGAAIAAALETARQDAKQQKGGRNGGTNGDGGLTDDSSTSSGLEDASDELYDDHPLICGHGAQCARTFTLLARSPSRLLFLPASDARILHKRGVLLRLLRRARRDEASAVSGQFRELAQADRKKRLEARGQELRDILPHYRPKRWANRNDHMGSLRDSLASLTGERPLGEAARRGQAVRPEAAVSSLISEQAARSLVRGAVRRGRQLGGLESLSRPRFQLSFGAASAAGASRQSPMRGPHATGASRSVSSLPPLSPEVRRGQAWDGGGAGGEAWHPGDSSRLEASVSSLPSLASLDSEPSFSSPSLAHFPDNASSSLASLVSLWGAAGAESTADAVAPPPSALATAVARKKTEAEAARLMERAKYLRKKGQSELASVEEWKAAVIQAGEGTVKGSQSAISAASHGLMAKRDAEEAARGWANPLSRLELMLGGEDLSGATASAGARKGVSGAAHAARARLVKAQIARDEAERKRGVRDVRDGGDSGSVVSDSTARHGGARSTHRRKGASRNDGRSKLFSPLSLVTTTSARRGMRAGAARARPARETPGAQISGSTSAGTPDGWQGAMTGNPTSLGRSASVADLPRAPARLGVRMARVPSRFRLSLPDRRGDGAAQVDSGKPGGLGLSGSASVSGLPRTMSGKGLPSRRPAPLVRSTGSKMKQMSSRAVLSGESGMRRLTQGGKGSGGVIRNDEAQMRRTRAVASARSRGLLPTASFTVSMASRASREAVNSPRERALRELVPSPLPHLALQSQLEAISDADTVSTDSSDSSSEHNESQTGKGRHPNADGGLPPKGAPTKQNNMQRHRRRQRHHRREKGEKAMPVRRAKRPAARRSKSKRRLSTTIAGNLKLGTLSTALDMPMGDAEALIVAEALMANAE